MKLFRNFFKTQSEKEATPPSAEVETISTKGDDDMPGLIENASEEDLNQYDQSKFKNTIFTLLLDQKFNQELKQNQYLFEMISPAISLSAPVVSMLYPNQSDNTDKARKKGERYGPLIAAVPAAIGGTWALKQTIAPVLGIDNFQCNLFTAIMLTGITAYGLQNNKMLRAIGGEIGVNMGIKNIERTERVVCAALATLVISSNINMPAKVVAGVAAANVFATGLDPTIEKVKMIAETGQNAVESVGQAIQTSQEAISILFRNSKIMRPAMIASGALGITAYSLSIVGITAVGSVPIVYPMLITAVCITLAASIYCFINDNMKKTTTALQKNLLDATINRECNKIKGIGGEEILTIGPETANKILEKGEMNTQTFAQLMTERLQLMQDMTQEQLTTLSKCSLDLIQAIRSKFAVKTSLVKP